jgi:RNA polymerase sigma factor (sigma-70 family)
MSEVPGPGALKMSALRVHRIVRDLHSALAARQIVELTEAELWDRYVRQCDEQAFATIVRRHGPMVFAVCRRILRNQQDAEDAFQATFLVLVRRAASLQSPCTLASWLHGVARRTALEARATAARRRAREAAAPARTVMPEHSPDELWPILDEELARLTEKYRVAVILCDLEGNTRKEAARQLGWAEGTVASRLARGRCILARRLARRGFTAAVAVPACVSAALVNATVQGAGYSAVHSRHIAALAEGVLQAMTFTKLKTVAIALLIAGVLTFGAGALSSWSRATEPAPAQDKQAANQDRLHDQVQQLKRQLQQMQQQLARIEQEAQPRKEASWRPDAFLASRFKYRIAVEIGESETREGGRLVIQEVWGTRPRIEVGGLYVVHGTYTLPGGQRGKLYFYETADGAWGNSGIATMDLQTVDLEQEKGEFTVMHVMGGPGYFHLYLASPESYSRYFANVYFGTGPSVLRKSR